MTGTVRMMLTREDLENPPWLKTLLGLRLMTVRRLPKPPRAEVTGLEWMNEENEPPPPRKFRRETIARLLAWARVSFRSGGHNGSGCLDQVPQFSGKAHKAATRKKPKSRVSRKKRVTNKRVS